MDRISMITALFARALAIKSIGGDSLSYIGVTTTALSDGATTNPITIDGDTVTATNGNVALYSGDAFVFNGTIWQASSAISQIFSEIGDLSDLDTESKTDLVSAINEVNEEKQDDVELSLTPTAVVSDRDIQDGQGNTLSVLAEALTKTASGNPVVITDCAGGKARSLITEINAIQDLHGQSAPYVGGAGKNKLPMTVSAIKAANTSGTWNGNAYTDRGVTFTILTDSDNNVIGIKATGTASGDSPSFYLGKNISLTNGNYILNGCPADGSVPTYCMIAEWSGGDVKDLGSGISLSVSGNTINVRIRLQQDYAITSGGITFYPMIRLSTESDASFAPYSNICPISGRGEVEIADEGKNLVDETIEKSNIVSNGGIQESENPVYDVHIAPVKKGSPYILTTGNMGSEAYVYAFFTNRPIRGSASYNGVRYVTRVTAITAPFDGYLAFRTAHGYTTPQCEYGTVTTAYTPYVTPTNATISLGQTVYGADINWDDGTADLLTAITVFDGSEDETINTYSARNGFQFTSGFNGMAAGDFVSGKCNRAPIATAVTQHAVRLFDNTALWLYAQDDLSITTVANLRTYLSSNPLQIEYKLATPTTIQLTPEQLQMLKGYNRVTIESGSIEIEYIAKAISGNDEEIAPLVGDKATKSYAVNDFIERADGLYRVTAPIASGASFTANNTVKMSIGEALTYLYNK